MSASAGDSLRVAFLHPHLGIGGAERWIVDAASELQQRGHQVTLFALSRDPTHSFEETRNGSLDIELSRIHLPLGRQLRAPAMLFDMHRIAIKVARRRGQFDVAICDLVAHTIPALRRLSGLPVVYYCHFPDVLLTQQRRRGLYQMYRWPIDRLERIGIASADRVLVNSRFTQQALTRAFPHLRKPVDVLYPGVAVSPEVATLRQLRSDALTILSLNRFHPDKNLELALHAVAALRPRLGEQRFARIRLVLAGGYDSRFLEQRRTCERLEKLARSLDLEDHVEMLRSVSDDERHRLLSRCACFLYTPAGEHFGLGPVEAMLLGKPVVAVDGGGVRETVVDGETGFLCPPEPNAFAQALAALIESPAMLERMGAAAHRHAASLFSRPVFGARFETILREVVTQARARAADTRP